MGIFTNKANVSDDFKDKLTKIINGEAVEAQPVNETLISESADGLEQLDEAELFEQLEEELTGYISHLMTEGFSDDEIESLILLALDGESEEEQAE